MDRKKWKHLCKGIIPLILAGNSALFADQLPGPTMPEQVAKALQPKPSVTPISAAATPQYQNKMKHPAMEAAQLKLKFKLNNIRLHGNTVFTNEKLLPLYKSKLHKTITVGELFEIVDSITDFYRNSGYVLSFATLPPQRGKKGVVTINIVEGYLASVSVIGDARGAKCLTLGITQRFTKCPPMNIDKLRNAMLLDNEIPGVTSRAIIRPAAKGLGAADLFLDTHANIFSAYVSYDDYGTRYIGPQQMTASATLYSAISSGDSTQVVFTKTPKGNELGFLDVNYNAPWGDNGTRWTMGVTRVRTHPLFVLAPFNVDGFSSNFYTSVIYPYIRTRSQSLNLSFGFNYLDSNTTQLDLPLYTDHLRSLDLGFNYNFADSYYGSNLLLANFRKGLPILGYTGDTSQFTASTSRPGGYAAYTKLTAQYSRLQTITNRLSFLGLMRGTWAFVPLLSSEQYTFGGITLGRGYDPSEIIGDRGFGGSMELRYDVTLNYFISPLQFYTFYDIGAMWNILVNAASPAKISASSAGTGVRVNITKYVSGNFLWAQPLTKQVAAEQLIGKGWRPRVFFSLVLSI
jgi:hemolysin activation/secretion protein